MRTTFSRNSAGWTFGADGTLHEFDADKPRVDCDLVTGRRLGLLIEQASTNYINDSVNMSSLTAHSSNLTGNYPDPLGRNNAKKWQCNQGDGVYSTVLEEAYDSTSGESSRRVYVKAGTFRYVRLSFTHAQDRYGARLDLETGETVTDNVSVLLCRALNDGWYELGVYGNVRHSGFELYMTSAIKTGDGQSAEQHTNDDFVYVAYPQFEYPNQWTSPIITTGSSLTRAADFLDAPGANNEYGPGKHTWQCAVRMSRDPGEPTILGYADGRIYASDGRLHLDGPGTLWQPDGEHAPGDYVPFYWTTQFAGAAPDFSLGRGIDDANWWNGHLVDIVPYPRTIRESEIRRELGL